MDLIPIGRAAARFGMSTSALRYYDERKLVCPSARRAGKRMYGAEQLRRLAFIKIVHRLGLPLQTAAAVLDAPGPQWRETLRRQIAELDQLIAQAQLAQTFLAHALNCPTEHPARECAAMIATLDRLVDGTPIDRLAAEHQRRPTLPASAESGITAPAS
ncbi:MAG: MerR family transcriptional regulator [Mycobacterium sp.]|jgi:DNA-binding transcriptional MerR regulator|nr:MerR family transcriptional regulator [Mycobacterium sp.]